MLSEQVAKSKKLWIDLVLTGEETKLNESLLDYKYDNSLGGLRTTNGRKRERISILEEQLQLTLNIEESFAIVNRYQTYKTELSEICSTLLIEQLLSGNFIQVSNAYKNMIKKSPF